MERADRHGARPSRGCAAALPAATTHSARYGTGPVQAATSPQQIAELTMDARAVHQRTLAHIERSPTVVAQRRGLDAIGGSPAMLAQRQHLSTLFGPNVQLQTAPEDENLQRKTAARVLQGLALKDDEGSVLGRSAPTQRLEEEEQPQQGKFGVAKLAEEEEAALQGQFSPAQRVEEEEPLQARTGTDIAGPAGGARRNGIGMPDLLKSGMESLSGLSMDHVQVHYNSARPAQLNALAYAQGTDIHLSPGQEQHLPHEAWDVVQQSQGRVRPTMQLQGGVPVNEEHALEREADVMGARAALDPAALGRVRC